MLWGSLGQRDVPYSVDRYEGTNRLSAVLPALLSVEDMPKRQLNERFYFSAGCCTMQARPVNLGSDTFAATLNIGEVLFTLLLVPLSSSTFPTSFSVCSTRSFARYS